MALIDEKIDLALENIHDNPDYVPSDESFLGSVPYMFQRRVNQLHSKTLIFLSAKSFEAAITNRKTDTDGAPLNWLKIQWLCFNKGQPDKIHFKYTLEEEMPFSAIDVKKLWQVGKPHQFSSIPNQNTMI